MRMLRGREDLRLVAVNDLAPASTLAHLLRHDSIHGPFPGVVEARGGDALLLDERLLPYSRIRAPGEIPWSENGVDVVIEATGQFSGNDEGPKLWQILGGTAPGCWSAPRHCRRGGQAEIDRSAASNDPAPGPKTP
ncbi:MAG: glyceraldehyde 3-phosphate dehydrogenase NAD-binding domain-containing protein [Acidobacteriota bacterium]|nr:glyceraldehyde 3-phosphate dehydrogenase NAD-binding domain-containing protein [Acidobacteriota bacterium]